MKKARFYLEESHRFFDSVNEVRRKLDDKIHNMIILSGVLTNIVFGLLYFSIEQKIITNPCTQKWFFFTALAYLIVAIIGIFVYRWIKLLQLILLNPH